MNMDPKRATPYPALANDRRLIAVELQGHGHTADLDRLIARFLDGPMPEPSSPEQRSHSRS